VLASAAGLTVYQYNRDIHGIDLGICREEPGHHCRSPKIEVQVKTVSRPTHRGGALVYDGLDARQYDKLAGPLFQLPRYLFVVVVPPRAELWADLGPQGLLLRHIGYYLPMRDQPALPAGRASARLAVPTANVLTVERLQALVEAAV
jgi:hypothetical protein